MRASARRLDEIKLAFLAVLLAALGFVQVTTARREGISLAHLFPALTLAVLLFAGWLWLRWRCSRSDQVIFPLAGVLSALSLILVYRLQPDLLSRQIIWLILGVALMLVVVSLPNLLSWLKRYKYTWAFVGIGLMVITLVFGIDPNRSGARLWLGHGEFLFQPSEILKVLLVAFLAGYIEDKRELISSGYHRFGPLELPPLPYLGPMLVMWGLSLVLLVGQMDIGPTFLLFALFLSVLYLATSRVQYVWSGLLMFLVAGYGAYHLSSHVSGRIDVWLNPWADPQGRGFQVIQGLLAFANGGVSGTGLARGYPGLIPAVFTDFPMAAIGEELGLLGALATVALYLLFVHRGFKIAIEARDTFSQILAAGLTASVGIQALIIIAGNLKLIPLTGITLPFVSYGGSSLVTNFIILGLLLRISHESYTPPESAGAQ